jgi:DNA-binding phage protein
VDVGSQDLALEGFQYWPSFTYVLAQLHLVTRARGMSIIAPKQPQNPEVLSATTEAHALEAWGRSGGTRP